MEHHFHIFHASLFDNEGPLKTGIPDGDLYTAAAS